MNWQDKSEKYPKAINKLVEFGMGYMSRYSPEDHPNDIYFHIYTDHSIRELYDFFDENRINIIITPEYYYDGINWNWQILWLDLDSPHLCDGTVMYGDNAEYKTRTEAEQAAFDKAFEILEQKLC